MTKHGYEPIHPALASRTTCQVLSHNDQYRPEHASHHHQAGNRCTRRKICRPLSGGFHDDVERISDGNTLNRLLGNQVSDIAVRDRHPWIPTPRLFSYTSQGFPTPFPTPNSPHDDLSRKYFERRGWKSTSLSMGRHETTWEAFPKSGWKYHNKHHNTENVVDVVSSNPRREMPWMISDHGRFQAHKKERSHPLRS